MSLGDTPRGVGNYGFSHDSFPFFFIKILKVPFLSKYLVSDDISFCTFYEAGSKRPLNIYEKV